MAFLPKGKRTPPQGPIETHLINGTIPVRNSLRKNQLTIAEKDRQLQDKYKIKLNPFLAKECGYSPREIAQYFSLPLPPLVTIDSDEDENVL